MERIDVKTFVRYNNGEMTPQEKRKVESFLKTNPHYIKVLRGLSNLQERLGANADIEEFLEQKKNSIKPGLFRPR